MNNVNTADAPTTPPLPPQIAGFWRRFFGIFIDGLILGAIGAGLGFFFFNAFVQIGSWGRAIGFMVALLYFGLMNSRLFDGQTLGKRAVKTRVVSRDGRSLSVEAAVARYLVLGIPWFLNGSHLPQHALMSWLGILLSVLVFGVGGSIIYLILFNRRTRQSLHDLVIGSFVLKSDSPKGPVILTTWKGHYVVVAILVIIAAVIPQLLGPLAKGEFFKPMLALQQQIEKEPDVSYCAIYEGQTFFTSSGGTAKTTTLTVTVFTKKNTDHEVLANRVAAVIFGHFPRALEKDRVTVTVVYGYDIGISSFWRSSPFSFSPQQWQERLKVAAFARLTPAAFLM